MDTPLGWIADLLIDDDYTAPAIRADSPLLGFDGCSADPLWCPAKDYVREFPSSRNKASAPLSYSSPLTRHPQPLPPSPALSRQSSSSSRHTSPLPPFASPTRRESRFPSVSSFHSLSDTDHRHAVYIPTQSPVDELNASLSTPSLSPASASSTQSLLGNFGAPRTPTPRVPQSPSQIYLGSPTPTPPTNNSKEELSPSGLTSRWSLASSLAGNDDGTRSNTGHLVASLSRRTKSRRASKDSRSRRDSSTLFSPRTEDVPARADEKQKEKMGKRKRLVSFIAKFAASSISDKQRVPPLPLSTFVASYDPDDDLPPPTPTDSVMGSLGVCSYTTASSDANHDAYPFDHDRHSDRALLPATILEVPVPPPPTPYLPSTTLPIIHPPHPHPLARTLRAPPSLGTLSTASKSRVSLVSDFVRRKFGSEGDVAGNSVPPPAMPLDVHAHAHVPPSLDHGHGGALGHGTDGAGAVRAPVELVGPMMVRGEVGQDERRMRRRGVVTQAGIRPGSSNGRGKSEVLGRPRGFGAGATAGATMVTSRLRSESVASFQRTRSATGGDVSGNGDQRTTVETSRRRRMGLGMSLRKSNKRKLVVSGVAADNVRGYEAVKAWCESFGQIRSISRKSDGNLVVDFRKASVADTVCRVHAQVHIKGAGSVYLSWTLTK